MRSIVIPFVMLAFITACTTNSKETKVATADITDSSHMMKGSESSIPATAPISGVLVQHYLHIKNALTEDNGTEAATAAKQMVAAMQQVDAGSFSAEQQKVFDDVKDNMKEHAEHVSTNAAKLDHQREHFEMLSQDMYDMLKVFKPSQQLFLTHCPMYNDNKGANWLSETKDIKNPFYGKKMLDCGLVKEEINP